MPLLVLGYSIHLVFAPVSLSKFYSHLINFLCSFLAESERIFEQTLFSFNSELE